MWQYESPNFEAGSSLPALSLLVAETPTQPGIAVPEVDAIDVIPADDPWIVGTSEAYPPADAWQAETELPPTPLHSAPAPTGLPDSSPRAAPRTRRLSDIAGVADISDAAAIDEIDTVPPRIDEVDTMPEMIEMPSTEQHAHSPFAHLDQIDTLPEMMKTRSASSAEQALSRALVPVNPQVTTIPATGSASWTAGGSTRSGYARHIADRTPRKKRRSRLSLNPFDSVRWWLLRPGRIEFILWLGGTILLISVTCILLLVTAFSLNWITPGLRSNIASSSSLTSPSSQGHVLPTVTDTPGLVLTLLDKGPFLPGQSIHVHGQGFTHNGKVDFTLDSPQLPSNPVSVTADPHGAFTTTLSLGYGLAPGLHLLIAHDMKTDSLAVVPFAVTSGDTGKRATATPVPVTPGATITPTPGHAGGGGGNPVTPTPITTPVNTTPVPQTPTPTPTKTPTPTPTPVPPTPTPTVGVTPTPTPGTTPTPQPSATSAVPTSPSPTPNASPTAAVPLSSALSSDSGPGDGFSNAIGSNTPALGAQLARFAPWLWLPVLLSTLSMLMLGFAGVLHRRRR